MSEIKGQILGVVLVLAIFGVVGTTLYGAFASAGNKVADKISDSIEEGSIKGDTETETDFIADSSDLMSF